MFAQKLPSMPILFGSDPDSIKEDVDSDSQYGIPNAL
jgi:hypothetical protein